MPTDHEIKPGEHLVRIAAASARSYRPIWDADENAALRTTCDNPNVLLPGEHVTIADQAVGTKSVPTGKLHRFVVRVDALDLHLVLHDENDKPIGGKTCELLDAGEERSTDDSGQVDVKDLPPDREIGRLLFDYKTVDLSERGEDPPDAPDEEKVFSGEEVALRRFAVAIGHLDPVTSLSGIQARLNNLGYYAGDVGYADDDPQALRCAIEEFELEHKLKPVGDPANGAMQAKLKEVYGC